MALATCCGNELLRQEVARLTEENLRIRRALFGTKFEQMEKRGNRGGRKPALDAKAAEQVKLLMKDRNIRPTDLAKTYDVSRTTIYKLAKDAA